ncbi:hypothetical protein BKA65DRAFT_184467 [Rhexocercosporidium sp. MPI-PUGE-AT-0058]|nr:hypothetical protein BKA65DRAFT_184467 [Rhexocercosporidium sp. MPI-PUGE-AT-0058]
MPKPKQFTKLPKKKSKHVQAVPETADEYLAAGVDFEEAGEKWRGGDAAKSTRFFIRAIDCYDEALKKFPKSFDLAYNKARVQYEFTQHPKLLQQLPGSLLDLLQTALTSSKYALSLNGDNADALFNTAQIFTSLAEKLAESSTDGSTLHFLEEALRLFQLCLEVQEKQAQESVAQAQLAESMISENGTESIVQNASNSEESGGVSLSGDSAMDVDDGKEPAQDERWASIVEPVDNDVLLDTVLAQLETLTQMCGLMLNVSEQGIGWVEGYAKDLINAKLDTYLTNTTRSMEAALTKANFISAFTNLQFQANLVDAKRYADAIQTAYTPLDLTTSAEGLCSYAESLIAFNSTLRLQLLNHPGTNNQETLSARWTALTTALANLTAASKIPGVDNIVKIHIARGDVEISRFQLGQMEDVVFEKARGNRDVLLRNAGKFYLGAKSIAGSEGLEDESVEAAVKEALVKGLLGDGKELKIAVEQFPRGGALLAEMVDEGLATGRQLESMGVSC